MAELQIVILCEKNVRLANIMMHNIARVETVETFKHLSRHFKDTFFSDSLLVTSLLKLLLARSNVLLQVATLAQFHDHANFVARATGEVGLVLEGLLILDQVWMVDGFQCFQVLLEKNEIVFIHGLALDEGENFAVNPPCHFVDQAAALLAAQLLADSVLFIQPALIEAPIADKNDDEEKRDDCCRYDNP